MSRIVMRTRYDEFEIELDDSDTAFKIFNALPIEREINLWGGEMFFDVPVEHPLENGRKIMEVGEVAFWPEGNALCIFFGPTPVSSTDKPEAYSPVTPVGKVISNLEKLEGLSDRTSVALEAIEEY